MLLVLRAMLLFIAFFLVMVRGPWKLVRFIASSSGMRALLTLVAFFPGMLADAEGLMASNGMPIVGMYLLGSVDHALLLTIHDGVLILHSPENLVGRWGP